MKYEVTCTFLIRIIRVKYCSSQKNNDIFKGGKYLELMYQGRHVEFQYTLCSSQTLHLTIDLSTTP